MRRDAHRHDAWPGRGHIDWYQVDNSPSAARTRAPSNARPSLRFSPVLSEGSNITAEGPGHEIVIDEIPMPMTVRPGNPRRASLRTDIVVEDQRGEKSVEREQRANVRTSVHSTRRNIRMSPSGTPVDINRRLLIASDIYRSAIGLRSARMLLTGGGPSVRLQSTAESPSAGTQFLLYCSTLPSGPRHPAKIEPCTTRTALSIDCIA